MPPNARKPAVRGRRLARALWRLGRVYWTSGDARWGAPLLVGAVALELATVWTQVLIADANRRIFDALEQKQADDFFRGIVFFLLLGLVFVIASTYRIFLRQTLEMRWRRSLTSHFVTRWMGAQAYVESKLHAGEIDNPDQRISEDVRDFVASALGLSLSLLAAIASLVSFGGLLWRLSSDWPVRIGGHELHVPGLMMWVAGGYALVSTWVTHLVGRRLVPINFDRLRVEADFRYGLVRFRDNVEPVALARGESVERMNALARFAHVIRNWWQLIRAQRNLSLLTTGLGYANDMVPVLAAAPAYFTHLITLGNIVQIRLAYGHVSGSLIWFVNAYQEIARWRASIERLATFSDVMDESERDLARREISIATSAGDRLSLQDLRLEAPGGRVLVEGANATVDPGERIVVTGPSGVGKTMLLRTIAGVWPFGSGRIELPRHDRLLFVPERPYLPLGTLRAVASFPAEEGSLPDERIREALRALDLAPLADRLDAVEPWDQVLTDAEKQRLALARVLLQEPEWVFLDKATSALDETTEARVYELLAERLPRAAIVTAAHRPAVARFHSREWRLRSRGEGPASLEAA
jgi:putative ATP-binding cassette transporter